MAEKDIAMVLTKSFMLPIGTIAPKFDLYEPLTGQTKSLTDLQSDRGTVVMFICNHCPFVIHIQDKLIEVVKSYQQQGIVFIGISSNNIETHPEDSPENMKALAIDRSLPYPYLYDETQAVAKAYHAECTPDFFIFDHQLKCVYRGRFDEATPGNDAPVTGKDLTDALDNMIAGKMIASHQMPSMGCNIKWK